MIHGVCFYILKGFKIKIALILKIVFNFWNVLIVLKALGIFEIDEWILYYDMALTLEARE